MEKSILAGIRTSIYLLLASGLILLTMQESTAQAQATAQVRMQNIAFLPQNITIAEGTTVVWTNNDPFDHTVTSGVPGSPSGLFDSGIVGPGATFSRQFNTSGTFPYFCTIHQSLMTGSVTVIRPAQVSEAGTNEIAPFVLYQNVPNPFNSRTLFSFDLKEQGDVTFTIYTITGQKVWEQILQDAAPGRHTAVWRAVDGSGNALSAGMYFYSLRLGGTAAVRRMLYLK